jgi:hypothetical protein
MRRILIILAASLTLGIWLPVLAYTARCEHEYSSNCVWWGPWQGNGNGSIVVN